MVKKMAFLQRLESKINHMTKADFAKKIGVHVSTISLWRDDKLPKGETLKRISKEFGISVDWLLTGGGEPYLTDQTGREGVSVLSSTLKEVSGRGFQSSASHQASIAQSIEMLMKIMGSNNQKLIRAIVSNLDAFSEAVDQKDRLVALEEKVDTLMADVSRLQDENKDLRIRLNRMKAVHENPSTAPGPKGEAI